MYNILESKSDERKSNSFICNRDGMSLAESIPYRDRSEVHPGACSVKDYLAVHGSSRYLYEDVYRG